jgi:gelsolin
MIKQKQYNIADSNIANLGSDLDKKVRQAAANTEPAWANAGKNVGLEIWRIEKFKVVSWPKEQYGQFYSGDSYLVLHTYKNKDSNALRWDVHFWLGKFTSQDEAGTAAYKTVELDDKLGGAPVQHREVQEHESALFLGYFRNQITILDGGVESGFRHVEPEKYEPRLLHLKGKKRVRVAQVPLQRDSLNSGDCFILDAGLNVYQFNGRRCGPSEKSKAASVCRALCDERKGQPTLHVFEEGDKEAVPFWKFLGGEGAIKSAEEGGSDLDTDKVDDKRLFRLSDSSGKLAFAEVARAGQIKRNMLDSSDVFILDSGAEVFAWIGRGASVQEKQNSLSYAQEYLTKHNRPAYISISRILEGGENEIFEACFRS